MKGAMEGNEGDATSGWWELWSLQQYISVILKTRLSVSLCLSVSISV